MKDLLLLPFRYCNTVNLKHHSGCLYVYCMYKTKSLTQTVDHFQLLFSVVRIKSLKTVFNADFDIKRFSLVKDKLNCLHPFLLEQSHVVFQLSN